MLEQHPRRNAEWRSTTSDLSKLSDECLIASKPLKELLGRCSDMHIWRLLNKEKYKPLAFPKPFKINDRNYWRLGVVRQWIREREAQSQAPASIVDTPKQNRAQNRRRSRRHRKALHDPRASGVGPRPRQTMGEKASRMHVVS
jgi:predicted DNA-binding transcriptional regulator AlpA